MEKTIRPVVWGFLINHYIMLVPFSILVLVVGIALYFSGVEMLEPAGIFAILILAVSFAFAGAHAVLHCKVTSIQFDGNKLIYETGIIHHKRKKAAIHMITDSSVSRKLIEQVFGLATMRINTSGTATYEIVCDSLVRKDADEMHNHLYDVLNMISKRHQAEPGQGREKEKKEI